MGQWFSRYRLLTKTTCYVALLASGLYLGLGANAELIVNAKIHDYKVGKTFLKLIAPTYTLAVTGLVWNAASTDTNNEKLVDTGFEEELEGAEI